MRVGGREVVGNGTIVTHAGDGIVELAYEDLKFRLTFSAGTQLPREPRVASEVRPDCLELMLTGFEDALGIAWYGQVANLNNGKKLHLALMVHTVGAGETISRSIGFTFSTEEV